MSRTILAMYADRSVAETVVRDLLDAGIDRDRLAVAVEDAEQRYWELSTPADRRRERRGGLGAAIGLFLGAAIGVLLALIAAQVPDPGWTLGPDLVASLLLVGAIGASVGVVLGWLTGAMWRRGVPIPPRHPDGALAREQGVAVAVRRGGLRESRRVARLMERRGPIDIDRRARGFDGRSGWQPLLPAELPRQALEARGAGPSDRPLGSQRRGAESSPEGALPVTTPTSGLPEAWRALELRFRRHFERQHRDRGQSWDVHREAYEVGLRLAWDSRGKPFRSFHDLEDLARMRWESTEFGDTPYRHVRDSVIYAWEEGRLAFA